MNSWYEAGQEANRIWQKVNKDEQIKVDKVNAKSLNNAKANALFRQGCQPILNDFFRVMEAARYPGAEPVRSLIRKEPRKWHLTNVLGKYNMSTSTNGDWVIHTFSGSHEDDYGQSILRAEYAPPNKEALEDSIKLLQTALAWVLQSFDVPLPR